MLLYGDSPGILSAEFILGHVDVLARERLPSMAAVATDRPYILAGGAFVILFLLFVVNCAVNNKRLLSLSSLDYGLLLGTYRFRYRHIRHHTSAKIKTRIRQHILPRLRLLVACYRIRFCRFLLVVS